MTRPGMFASVGEAARVLWLALVLSAFGWVPVLGAWLWIARHP